MEDLDLNPSIETSGDTLTIGFRAQGLLPWIVWDEITTCDKYDSDTGACSSADVELGEPEGYRLIKEMFGAATGPAGCDGEDMGAMGSLLVGPSWKEVIDSTDHWLEHLKEGFAFTVDICGNQNAVNAMYDKAIEIELREDGTSALDDLFPRELFAIWQGNWMAVELTNEAIDEMIDDWPDVFNDGANSTFDHPHPVNVYGPNPGGSSGVFTEDLLTVFGVEYNWLLDYRSPYADVSELWEGSFEE